MFSTAIGSSEHSDCGGPEGLLYKLNITHPYTGNGKPYYAHFMDEKTGSHRQLEGAGRDFEVGSSASASRLCSASLMERQVCTSCLRLILHGASQASGSAPRPGSQRLKFSRSAPDTVPVWKFRGDSKARVQARQPWVSHP